MKNNKKAVVYFILLLILITAFLYGFYGKIIMNPNAFIFGNSGDGMKNYYTYAYYIQNNNSYTNLEGMNYPYGENFTYTDCHPILAFMLKLLCQVFPGLSQYSLGILNLIMMLSLGLTAVILYVLFRELKVAPLLSVLGAMGIMALSPQLFRLTGHYGLSYSFFIPLTIYLLLLFEKGKKRVLISFLMAFSIFIFFMVHAYLGMIAATLVFTYICISMLNQLFKEKKIRLAKHLWLLASAMIPVGLYYLFVKITDIHTGRTTNPWGILENHAEMGSVFLPVNSPLDKIKGSLFPGVLQPWEGWSYIGLITIIVLVLFLAASVIRSVKTRSITLNKTWVENPTLRLLFIASIIILAFSMFVPFRWFNWQHLINYFDIIKQFRALGRFAWVFYFVSTIMLVCITNSAFQGLSKKKMHIPAYILMVIIPLLLFCEGWNYHKIMSKEIVKSPNFFDLKQTPETLRKDIESINTFHYQAILPFPFFYIGSDNYGKVADDKIYHLAFLFSYHLKLPMVCSYLTRTSVHESKKIMQLLASNFYHKDIQKDLPNDKPFLLVCLNGYLNSTESDYLKKATLLISREDYSIYEINTGTFFENTAVEEFEKFDEVKNSLFKKDGFLVSDTTLFFKYDDLENPGTDISFSGGKGCHFGLQKDYHTLLSVEKGKLPLNKNYTARFWMYNHGENFGQDCLNGMFFFQKNKGGQVEWLQPLTTAITSHEINGDWSLVELSFENTDNEASYDLVFKGSDIAEKTIYIDDLLFYDSDLVIYKLLNLRNRICLFRNNHRIDMPVSIAR
ncbi:MAG TPA: hypothetical protein PKN48_03705 [Bacteroidales bacterium]|nr:hypothetical protein [Bacteroidales bacterium]